MLDHTTVTFDIQEVGNYQFDATKLKTEIENALVQCGLNPKSSNQINIYHRESEVDLPNDVKFTNWVGSLCPIKNGSGILIDESEFNTIHPLLKGSYTEETLEQLRKDSSFPFGRIRWLGLNPKSCYSWHTDPDLIRYHIPITTFPAAFFVVDTGIYRMPEEGKVYSILSSKWHTAVNAHLNTRRIHLVADTYDPTAPNPYINYKNVAELSDEEIQRKFDTSNVY